MAFHCTYLNSHLRDTVKPLLCRPPREGKIKSNHWFIVPFVPFWDTLQAVIYIEDITWPCGDMNFIFEC